MMSSYELVQTTNSFSLTQVKQKKLSKNLFLRQSLFFPKLKYLRNLDAKNRIGPAGRH